MAKTIYIALVSSVLLSINATAQFTNKLEYVCGKDSTIEGNGTITFPPADFAICAYTTQIFVNNKWLDVKVNEKTPQNGLYSFKYTIPAAGRNVTALQVRTVTNRQTISAFTIQKKCLDLKTGTWVIQDGESKTAIMKLKFTAGGQVELEKMFDGNEKSTQLKWSGWPNNFLVEGTVKGRMIKITGNVYNNTCTTSFNGITTQCGIGQ